MLLTEAGLANDHFRDRSALSALFESGAAEAPVLLEVVQLALAAPADTADAVGAAAALPAAELAEARLKFNACDRDGNGVIDKQELGTLFQNIFPDFPRLGGVSFLKTQKHQHKPRFVCRSVICSMIIERC